MSNRISAPIYARAEGTASSVGTSGTEIQMTVPIRGIIKRVQAYKVSGGMATFDLVTLRAATGATVAAAPLNVIPEYGPGSASIDAEESIFYEVAETTPGAGTLFFFVDPNTGTSDITARLDIQLVQ